MSYLIEKMITKPLHAEVFVQNKSEFVFYIVC